MVRTCLLAISLLALSTSTARAQSPTTGAISGIVTDRETKEPLAGVTVVIQGKARDVSSAVITDELGFYKVSDLLPDDYAVTFYVETATVTRDNIHVGANETVSVYQKIALATDKNVIYVDDTPPIVRTDRTDRGFKRTQQDIRSLPQPGRTATDVAGAAAGAQNDGLGISFSGSTSLENRYLVDGIDITGLTYGTVGTPVLNDFVEEIEVLTGGYNAEWGRAIGGIVNVVTKSGTNTFRGSVFGHITPGILTRATKAAPTNASSIDVRANRVYNADLGFELGGPIVKNFLWFYVGLAPTVGRTDVTRTTKRQSDCRTVLPDGSLSNCDPRPNGTGYADGKPDVDPSTGFYITDEIDNEVRSATSSSLSALAKLSLRASDTQQGQLTFLAVPSKDRSPGIYGLPSTATQSSGLTTDAAARWTAKLDEGATELSATLAWHRSTFNSGALDPALDADPREVLSNGNLGTLARLGGESAATAAGCTDGGPDDPYPYITNCPMQSLPYAIGGPGAIDRDLEDRKTIRLGATHRAKLFGDHEIMAGLDYETASKTGSRIYSGGKFIQNSILGSIRVTRWVALAGPDDKDPRYDETCRTPDDNAAGANGGAKEFRCDFIAGTPGAPGTRIEGNTRNWAAYLRDSWRPMRGLTINAGVRYEEQKLFYASALRGKPDPLTGNLIGDVAMNLTNNWAPRLGVIYDPTYEGKSKVYAAWGRFFEAIPMDINDRSFGGEVSYTQDFNATGANPPCGPVDPAIGGPRGTNCTGAPASEQLIGSSGVLVAPGIGAQYLDETIVGLEYQIAKNLAIGFAYQNRRLGRVIEDVSTDGAQTYVIANPGEFSAAEEQQLEQRIARTDDPAAKRRLERDLALYKGIRVFDKPARDYDALEMTLAHRAPKGIFVQGSYTYSRTRGNYPGLLSYDNGQVDPNISSQYDLIELLANRRGPLPQDRPHIVKLDAYRNFELGKAKTQLLTVGARFRATSGAPISALGGHYLYGPDESFILPRGTLGRTDIQHSFDLHLSYGRRLTKSGVALEVFVDLYNLYNNQGTFSVDQTYAPAFTADGRQQNVMPISGGSPEDLIWAKSFDSAGNETATPIGRNPNFKNTQQRYAPTSAQIGFRLTF